MAKPRYTAQQVVEALKETKGLVYLAAKKLGCDPETIHNYAKRHVAVKQAMQTARGEMVDVAEAKLYQAVTNGEQWAVLFSLRTQGKERGYVERVQAEVGNKDDWRDEAKAAGVDPEKLLTVLVKEVKHDTGDSDA